MRNSIIFLALLFFLAFHFQTYCQPEFIKPISKNSKNYLAFKNRVYFTGSDTLWKVSGNSATPIFTSLASPTNFHGLYDYMLFEDSTGLWLTSGLEGETKYLGAYVGITNPTAINNMTLFWASEKGTTNKEVYKVTPLHTVELVKDIYLGSSGSFYTTQKSAFHVVGSHAYFVANDGVHGNELWVTAGTEASTKLVADFYPDRSALWPTDFAVLEDNIYFFTDSTNAFSLWKSNPVSSQTYKLKEFEIDSTHYGWYGPPYTYPSLGKQLFFGEIESVNGSIFFETATVDTSNNSYGTTISVWGYSPDLQQPVIIKEIENSGIVGSAFRLFSYPVNDKVVFIHSFENPIHEIWITDGCEQGTKFLKRLSVGPAQYFDRFYPAGNHLMISMQPYQNNSGFYKIDPQSNISYVRGFSPGYDMPVEETESDKFFFYWNYERYSDIDENIPPSLYMLNLETPQPERLVVKYPGYDAIFNNAADLVMLEDTLYFTSGENLYRLNVSSLVSATSKTSLQEVVQAFPNPVEETLHLQFKADAVPVGIELVNLVGKTILSHKLNASAEVSINLSAYELPGGMYFVRSSDGTVLTKIIKK